jgi:hypothetical protein
LRARISITRKSLLAAQLVVAAIVAYFVARTLIAQWIAFRDTPLRAQLDVRYIIASGALVLGAHALLVQTWRAMLRGWSANVATAALSFWSAARIWSVSNLGKYVPGKIWQIGAMGTMAQRAGVSPAAAAGSAVLSTIINIAAGIAIVLGLGWRWIDQVLPDARTMAIVLIVVAVLGLVALPFVIPALAAVATRITGRELSLQSPPGRIVAIAIVGNLLAWVLYGLAFRWLVQGTLGATTLDVWQYIAVYTASYVIGYLFLFVPGGIGPREAVMVSLMTSLALATPKQAWLVAAASRVWLTILEITPGVAFVARDATRRSSGQNEPVRHSADETSATISASDAKTERR